ncbi:hypothetical protein V6x_50510 [Gimesia chilikensis]|uniref:Uncharacterized protein n=1 Tax=Gimesia chilikensis TaxID=2605989 RepID=A0A517WJ98_9PLAN|nr:hypothetical protein V6x_50510 [Gimesia chilikensis]
MVYSVRLPTSIVVKSARNTNKKMKKLFTGQVVVKKRDPELAVIQKMGQGDQRLSEASGGICRGLKEMIPSSHCLRLNMFSELRVWMNVASWR